jgi:hypothetical protein
MLQELLRMGNPTQVFEFPRKIKCSEQKLNLMAHEVLTSVWTRREIKVNSDSVRFI